MSNWAALSQLPVDAMLVHFGQTMTYTATGQSAVTIEAPFDENFEVMDMEEGNPVVGTQPVIDVRLSDLPVEPSQDDVVAIGSRTFKVGEVNVGAQGLSAKCFLVETTP